MKELLIIFTYTFIVAFIAIYLRQIMPSVIQYFKRVLTRKKRVSNAPATSTKQLEKLVIDIMKNKIDNGLLTYHKKKMIREFVREEVINYLNELKTK